MTNAANEHSSNRVNFASTRSNAAAFKADFKELFLSDSSFAEFKKESLPIKAKTMVQYYIPAFEWLPKYNLRMFMYDLLAGVTITTLAIPVGISYAKLANIPPIIGLYSSCVPPLIYAIFGTSKYMAIGSDISCALLLASIIEETVSQAVDPKLYLSLFITAAFISGIFMTAIGVLRLGIILDFLSDSTITGYMGGIAIIASLQQLRGFFGLKHFTTQTDVVSVVRAIFRNINEWEWKTALMGTIFLIFLEVTKFVKKKRPNLFYISAVAPLVVVITGALFTYFFHAEKHGIQIVGHLEKGLNPLSIKDLNFETKYIMAPLQAGIITAMIALAGGISLGKNFARKDNEQVDGNKEMLAFGLMNIVGSFTSCYLAAGSFSKTGVNVNAGCKTQMANAVQAICMMLTLLFLAPLFSYTPIVALSAIVISAIIGFLKYKKIYYLFKTDKFDFCICMIALVTVTFVRVDVGIMVSVGMAIIRALLYVARPVTCKLGNISNSTLYRDIEQYPEAAAVQGIIILKVGSPIYFANGSYIRERILRWVRDEQTSTDLSGCRVEHLVLELGGEVYNLSSVTSIDITGVETLIEVVKILEAKEIKVCLVNPRLEVMEKFTVTNFIEKIGKENVFLTVVDAVEACRFRMCKTIQ